MTLRPLRNALVLSLSLAGLGGLTSPLLAVSTPAAAQLAARNPQAEQYVQVEAQKALSVLSDKGLDKAQKMAAFRDLIDQIADVPRITRFVLGKYARTVTPDQYQQFSAVFRQYAQNVYETRLTEYHGEVIKVTGSVMRTPTDVVVASVVAGGKLDEPLPVSWRLLNNGGGWKIVDVQVKGVWLAITQQQDFVSTIDNHGGDVNVLIDQLQHDVKSHDIDRS